MVVFLLLGVIWAAVLVPPWLQARREARPIASMMSFRSQLRSLQAATPAYDDAYPVDDLVDVDAGVDATWTDAGWTDTGAAGPAVRSLAPVPPHHGGPVPRAPVAISRSTAVAARRARAFRRRRRVLSLLVALTAGAAWPAAVAGGAWVPAAVAVGTLLVAYVVLLVRYGRREVERAQKVRYLTPIRAPRPSVVVIGRGAAR